MNYSLLVTNGLFGHLPFYTFSRVIHFFIALKLGNWCILNKIDNYYDPLVNSLYNTPKINTTDDFLTQIRELIQTGLEFEVYQDFCAKRGSCLTLSFMTSDILSPINKDIETLFAKFLFNLKTLEEYGMTIDRNILTFFSGNIIVYHLRQSILGDMHNLVRDMIKFEKEKNSMDEYSKDLFEKN